MSINIIQKAFNTNHRKEPDCSRHDSSPVKTVLGEMRPPVTVLECSVIYQVGKLSRISFITIKLFSG